MNKSLTNVFSHSEDSVGTEEFKGCWMKKQTLLMVFLLKDQS